jgi:branched-chain amino acid transport system substrate-binding protein
MWKHLRTAAVAVPCIAMLAGGLTLASPAPASASGGFPAIPPGPITFGVSTSVTGADASYGVATKDGFEVALAQFKKAFPNGIDGHPVKLDFIDDQSSVTGAVDAANQMVASKVAAVITLTTDAEGVTGQVAVLQKAKVPIISSMESESFTNPKKYPYYFTAGESPGLDAEAAAKYIKAQGFTRVATITDGVPVAVAALDLITSAM